MYKSIKTGQFFRLLDRVACPLSDASHRTLQGIYVEDIKPDQAGDPRVVVCATDGHIICIRKMFLSDVEKVCLEDNYHLVKAKQRGACLYSHKKFLALDDSDKTDLVYPEFRRVLTDLKPLPAIATSNDPALRRYNLFDGDKLALCKSLMDGRVWIPNYAAPYPRGLWAYVEDDFLLGCMPLDTHDCSVEETRDYAAVFPELQYIEKKAKKKSEGV